MARTNRSSPNISQNPDDELPEEVIDETVTVEDSLPEEPQVEWEVPGEVENIVNLETWSSDCKTMSPELIGGFVHHARAINLRYDTPSGWKTKAIAWSRKPV
jgi:hypothetical protein